MELAGAGQVSGFVEPGNRVDVIATLAQPRVTRVSPSRARPAPLGVIDRPMPSAPTLELVGDWTSARLLIRLLQVIESPWELSALGLTHAETGETCLLEMRGPDPRIAERFAAGECPVRPSLLPETHEAIAGHRAVVTVRPAPDLEGWDAARAVLRCGSGIVDAGALAVRCRDSGLAHSGEHWQTLDRLATAAELEGDRARLAEALYLALVMPMAHAGDVRRTRGMALLEAADAVVSDNNVREANALDALEMVCLRTLSGQPPDPGQVLRASPSSPKFVVERGTDLDEGNPYGLWRLAPAPP